MGYYQRLDNVSPFLSTTQHSASPIGCTTAGDCLSTDGTYVHGGIIPHFANNLNPRQQHGRQLVARTDPHWSGQPFSEADLASTMNNSTTQSAFNHSLAPLSDPAALSLAKLHAAINRMPYEPTAYDHSPLEPTVDFVTPLQELNRTLPPAGTEPGGPDQVCTFKNALDFKFNNRLAASPDTSTQVNSEVPVQDYMASHSSTRATSVTQNLGYDDANAASSYQSSQATLPIESQVSYALNDMYHGAQPQHTPRTVPDDVTEVDSSVPSVVSGQNAAVDQVAGRLDAEIAAQLNQYGSQQIMPQGQSLSEYNLAQEQQAMPAYQASSQDQYAQQGQQPATYQAMVVAPQSSEHRSVLDNNATYYAPPGADRTTNPSQPLYSTSQSTTEALAYNYQMLHQYLVRAEQQVQSQQIAQRPSVVAAPSAVHTMPTGIVPYQSFHAPHATSSAFPTSLHISPVIAAPMTLVVPSTPTSTGRDDYKSVIVCGQRQADGTLLTKVYEPYFNKECEVFTASSDVTQRPLFRASLLSEKFNCASNRLCMYLARRKSGVDGIWQATSFVEKPSGHSGLKLGNYFVSIQACQVFASHFTKQVNRKIGRKESAEDDVQGPSQDNSDFDAESPHASYTVADSQLYAGSKRSSDADAADGDVYARAFKRHL